MNIDLKSITIEKLKSLKESVLRTEVIIPLLNEIGFDYVKDCHGSNECGIDIFIETNDFFERHKYYGISLKTGDINNKSKTDLNSIKIILMQMDEAFLTQFPSSNYELIYLHGYYIITSGSISQSAENYILKARPSYPYVDIINVQSLFEIIHKRDSLRNRYIGSKTNMYPAFKD